MFTFFHFSELKRRLKADKKAKEKAEKEQNEIAKPNAKSATKAAKQEEDINPNVFLPFYFTVLVFIS